MGSLPEANNLTPAELGTAPLVAGNPARIEYRLCPPVLTDELYDSGSDGWWLVRTWRMYSPSTTDPAGMVQTGTQRWKFVRMYRPSAVSYLVAYVAAAGSGFR